jgi:hypothetical protein
MKTGRIHAAGLDSPRLQAVLGALREAGARGLTTRDLIAKTGYCAVNSIVDELREHGLKIACGYERTTGQGGRVYRYTLVLESARQGELFG